MNTEQERKILPNVLQFLMYTTIELDNAKKDHVTLLTFNVHSWGDCNHRANFSRVLDIFRSLEPDVISLNEVSTDNFCCSQIPIFYYT